MALKLNFGSVGDMELSGEGDLSKYLQPGLAGLISMDSGLADVLTLPVSKVPTGSVSSNFTFNFTPSWKIKQKVGINLTVKPEATCTLRIIAPGGTIFTYYTGEDGVKNPVAAPANLYYIAIEIESSLSIDAGASWSSGDFGVSASIANSDQFRIANYYGVAPGVLLRDAIGQAFSQFALPFHADSIANLPSGDYLDFEFIGNLSLGFGATFGFSKMFFGGLSKGEVSASFASPIGKTVLSASPSFQAGAGFKINYSQKDDFRVVVGRTVQGASLYLLRKADSDLTETETFGITLTAGAKFATDASTLKAEAQTAVNGIFGPTAGAALGGKLGGVMDQAASDINSSVNQLLQKVNDKSIQLELTQSRSHDDTALFIYNFDFSFGTGAYGIAMNGDYARALAMPGVSLDPRSFVEQVYTRSAGISLQLFNVTAFQDVTTYIQKNDISYLGSGIFQIRSSAEGQAISKIFGAGREADLYFMAQCKSLSQTVSDVNVHLKTVFIDTNDASAYGESQRTMRALGLPEVADRMQAYVARYPKKPVTLMLDVDTACLELIDADDYLSHGRPAPEPHLKDRRNYEEFVRWVVQITGPVDTVAQTFESNFPEYADWLAFNRAVTDQDGSTRPGDRIDSGDTNAENWPAGYPPSDTALRGLVQSYILAGQEFMNFCAAIKGLVLAVAGVQTTDAYSVLYDSLAGMVRDESAFPTWFLKPSIAAMIRLAGVRLSLDGDLPDAATGDPFVISLQSAAAARVLAAVA